MTDLELSIAIEELLVSRNLRGMRTARAALEPGYYLRAAQHLRQLRGTVLIATGFPVSGTFETDGPVGAIALYDCMKDQGADPVLACGAPLSETLDQDYRLLKLRARDIEDAAAEARSHLEALAPQAVISIERPGLSEDGRYYNMRGDDITEHCAIFDPFIDQA